MHHRTATQGRGAMTRRLTEKEKERRARNRANAKASTGPRTAAGKARASRHAITRGLAARGPVDVAGVADRERHGAALALEIAPAGPVEAALVDRLAAAFRRLETADHLEARLCDGAFRLGDVPSGCGSTAGSTAAGGRPCRAATAPPPPAG
jgi:hypothetical protein